MAGWMDYLLDELGTRCSRDGFLLQGIERIRLALASVDHYVFRSPSLEQISLDAIEVASNEDLGELLNALAADVGFRYASIQVLEYGEHVAIGARCVTTLPEEWINHYRSEGYFFVDPLISRSRMTAGLIQASCNVAGDPALENYVRSCEEFEIGSDLFGFSLHFPDGTKGLVSFSGSTDQPIALDRRLHLLDDITQVCRDLFCAFADLNLSRCRLEDLTDAEKRFLATLAHSEFPQLAMEITPAFGSNASLQKGLMEKLGIRSLFQAAAIASKMNVVEKVQPSSRDIVRPRRLMRGSEYIAQTLAPPQHKDKSPDQFLDRMIAE